MNFLCELFCVKGDMVCHEGRDEVVAVVVALLSAQGQVDSFFSASLFQEVRFQLFFEKIVRLALIDEDGFVPRCRLYEFACIVGHPGFFVVSQVGVEGFLSPGTLRGRGDGREGRERAVSLRIAEGAGERAVSSHGVSCDANSRGIERERSVLRPLFCQCGQQLLFDVGAHAKVFLPGFLGCVQVESCALSQVVSLVVGDLVSARACVGSEEGDAVFCARLLREAFGRDILPSAGQP